ncbi:DUF4307 domain-containing protein [Kineosporia sp. J2-2]|uniref:DUF4307 domain-containing protein n=1 Tax=Kineosporia corallincola TaxID=2835133 RepID=A0ABS5THE8_9ACTN|nr:DUF4307 domain-containing protein [Kineosporia corallincola]MBT0770492.1 DUF4307 domain-containing protein [Kineosporia corallincola]
MTTPAESPATDDPAPTEPAADASAALARRYGRRRAPRRPVVIGALLVLAVLVLGFIYWATVIDRDRVTYQDHSFDVRSASQVVVTFDVQLHAGATKAICTVHALNSLGTEVGLTDVEVEGDDDNRVRMTVTLPTSEEATTGLVEECVAE